jgi:predicted transcriptional regulator
MNDSYPQWTTEITDKTVDGEDQLGVEGVAQTYQQTILPGITTVTDHARYYSFYAWIIYRFIYYGDPKKLVKNFRGLFFKRHEVALILSAYKHHEQGSPFSGVIGSGVNNIKVRRFWGDRNIASLDQEYFQNTEGGFGQYYHIAMQNMDILLEAEEPRLIYRLTDRGKRLAEAYEASIKDTSFFARLKQNEQIAEISEDEAKDYGHVGCICPNAIQLGKDKDLILDTFFRFDLPQDNSNPHIRRRNSLGVALDLVARADNQFQRDMLRPALYIGEYRPGLRYDPSLELGDWVKRWQMVEVRHIFTLGLQCLWAAFLLELNARNDITKQEWAEWLNSRIIENNWNTSVENVSKKICQEAGVSANFNELRKITQQSFLLQSELDEYSLYLKANLNQTNSKLLFQTGAKILLQLYLRFYQDYSTQNPLWKEIASRPRLPIEQFFKSMDEKLKTDKWSMTEWPSWVYQEYIFEQHEIIALEKLRYQEYDTFKFYFEEDTFHWPTGKKNYREPIRLAANRLGNCLTMLVDLGLISESSDGILSLTQEGKNYYKKVLEGFRQQ